jgi:metal-responsive CopG/Arc/MetJ family transcriptional regulator
MVYSIYMPAKGKTALNMNIDPDLLARIDKYRFKRMFASRSEAIEFLLEAALKLNPERPMPKGE